MKIPFFNLPKKDRFKIIVTVIITAVLLGLFWMPIPEKVYIGTNYLISTSTQNAVYPFYSPAYRLEYSITTSKEKQDLEELFFSSVSEVHKRLDRHNLYWIDDDLGETSGYIPNIAMLNESYGDLQGIPFDQMLWDYIQKGIEYTTLSEGSFHLAIGAISDFWNEILVSPSLTDEQLDPFNSLVRRQQLETLVSCLPPFDQLGSLLRHDEQTQRIFFDEFYSVELARPCTKNELSLSFGGLGKGIANDVLQNQLISHNFTKGLIYGGGSSITTLENRPFYDPWTIEFAYPFTYGDSYEDKEAAILSSTTPFSISQSGSYEGGFVEFLDEETTEWDHVWRHHIIDPRSGYPVNHHHAVIVYTEINYKSGLLDALSTAFLNMTIEEALVILDTLPIQVEVLFVLQTSRTTATIHATPGLVQHIAIGPGVTLVEI